MLYQQKRDLEWLINSPSLISQTSSAVSEITVFENLNDVVTRLSESSDHLHRKSDPTLDHISPKCPSYRRLGRYAECLFESWAKSHPAVTLLDSGVQVRDKSGNTLGEMDFLLKIHNQPVHLEMAVKFYLMADENAQLSSFVGPNPRDRFDLKYNKMVNQQIQWLQKENLDKGFEFDTKLSAEEFYQLWKRALLVKGMIFCHWKTKKEKIHLPKEINPHCDKGRWCYQKEWLGVLETENSIEKWMILPKLRWLSPGEPQDESEILTKKELMHEIIERNKPVMVAGLEVSKSHDLTEKSHLMVVPNNWNS